MRIQDEIRRITPFILLPAAVLLSDLQKKGIVPGGQFDRYAYRTGQTVHPVRDAGQTTIRVKIKSSGGNVNIRMGNGTSYSRITAQEIRSISMKSAEIIQNRVNTM